MKFWAAIVEPGQRVKVEVEEDKILHLSQASLGEIKKDKSNQNVNLFMHVPDTEDLVLSTLVPDKIPQQQLDLIFSNGFEVSHNWKNGTVYFYGYKTPSPFMGGDSDFESDSDSESESESESDEENITLVRPDNEGKSVIKKEVVKPAETKKGKAANESGAGKQKVKIVEPSPVKSDDDEDESDDSDEDEEDSDDSEDDSSDDSEEGEETPIKKEETPKKGQSGKKRPPTSTSEIETETPQGKKAKLITPQKTESKKGIVHVATPYPKTVKTSAATNKGQQTPKSAGSHSCKSCNKSFNSEAAIASHNKAKHSAGK